MNAQLKPVIAQILKRPSYDNQFLGFEADWIRMNEPLLRMWWDDCTAILPTSETLGSNDFELFCRAQHDGQLTVRDGYRNTLRQY